MSGDVQPIRGRARRTMIALAIGFFLILPLTAYMPGASAASIVWSTDKVVPDTQTYTGDTITMRGMLSVENGGMLKLDGVTLNVDGSYTGQYLPIEVQKGGTLIIRNSTVQSTDPGWRYFFRAFATSTLRITDSTIKHCGVGWSDENSLGDRGLYIATDDAVISGSTLRECTVGAVVDAAKPTIRTSTIIMNDESGVEIWNNGDPLVENNNISLNLLSLSWWVWPVGGVLVQSSAGRIYNNTITDNIDTNDWGESGGIRGDGTVNTRIVNNTIRDNVDRAGGSGVEIGGKGGGGTAFVDRNTISGHTYAIASNSATLTITNNTLKDNTFGQGGTSSGSGIFSSGSDTSLNNTITGNRNGIYLQQGASFSSLRDNITSCMQRGIMVETWGGGATGSFTNGTLSGNPVDLFLVDNGRGSTPEAIFLNMTFNRNAVTLQGTGAKFTLKWFLQVRVIWENGSRPVGGAAVNVTTNMNKALPLDPTNETTGITPEKAVEEFTRTGTGTAFSSPYNISASLGVKNNFTKPVIVDRNTLGTVILDDVAPPVEITSPAGGFLTNRVTVTVSGRSEPGVSLTVNDNPAVVPGNGLFTITVDLPLEGANTLTARAVDRSENSNETSITVFRDTKTPALAVTAPRQNFLVNRSLVEVVGTADDGSARVTVNGVNATLANGSFRYKLELANVANTDNGEPGDGLKRIVVEVRDAAGNLATATINGTLDSTPPPLTVASPPDGYLTNNSLVTIAGRTEKGAIVTFNGNSVNSGLEEFSLSYRLARGLNTLEFVAKDRAGNFARKVVLATYDPDPPLLDVSYPPDNFLTRFASMTMAVRTEIDANLSLNGDPLDFYTAEFNYTVTLQKGLNTLLFVATDPAGNTASLTRRVTLDMEPPVLTVISPANRTVTGGDSVSVTGRTEAGAVVSIGERSMTADGAGAFTLPVPLPMEGDNAFAVRATDAAGNARVAVLVVIRDTFAFLDVSAVPAKTKDASIRVAGRVEPRANLTVNGMAVSVALDGSFDTPVTLTLGENTLTFETHDYAGNMNQTVLKVVRQKRDATPSTIGAGTGSLPLIAGGLLAVLLIAGFGAFLFLRRRKGTAAQVPPPPPDFQQPYQAPPQAPEQAAQLPAPTPGTPSEAPAVPDEQQPVPGPEPEPQPQPRPEPEPEPGPEPPEEPQETAPVSQSQQGNELGMAGILLAEAGTVLSDLEAKGVMTEEARSIYRLAQAFYQEGNGEKALRYSRKAKTLIEDLQARMLAG